MADYVGSTGPNAIIERSILRASQHVALHCTVSDPMCDDQIEREHTGGRAHRTCACVHHHCVNVAFDSCMTHRDHPVTFMLELFLATFIACRLGSQLVVIDCNGGLCLVQTIMIVRSSACDARCVPCIVLSSKSLAS